MNKKTLIILIVLIFMVAGYFIYSIFISSKDMGAVVGEESSNTTGGSEEGPVIWFRTPTEEEKNEFPQGNKLVINGAGGSIEVKNFFQGVEGYWPEKNEVLITSNDKYNLIFDREFGNFDLVLRAGAKENDIPEIETAIMNLLGIGKNEICKLEISYFLEYDVIERIDMGTLPLCSSVLK